MAKAHVEALSGSRLWFAQRWNSLHRKSSVVTNAAVTETAPLPQSRAKEVHELFDARENRWKRLENQVSVEERIGDFINMRFLDRLTHIRLGLFTGIEGIEEDDIIQYRTGRDINGGNRILFALGTPIHPFLGIVMPMIGVEVLMIFNSNRIFDV